MLEALLADFEYDGIETCAADGACSLACPVGIDTGEFIRELRAAEHGEGERRIAAVAARSWGTVERATRAALEHPREARALSGRLRRRGRRTKKRGEKKRRDGVGADNTRVRDSAQGIS